MALDEEIKQMQSFIAQGLHETGQFSDIEPGFRFDKKGANSDGALNQHSKRHILARKKKELTPDGQKRAYLIVTMPDQIDTKGFAHKIAIADSMDFYFTPVLFKYLNKFPQAQTQGPFFKRVTLAMQKGEMGKVYHHSPTYLRDRLAFLGAERNNVFVTPRIEGRIIPAINNGEVTYYQPASTRLSEAIVRFQKREITPERLPQDTFPPRQYTDTFLLRHVDESNKFTLRPARIAGQYAAANAINEATHHTYDFWQDIGRNHLSIGEFLLLPDVGAVSEEDTTYLNKLASIRHELIRKPYEDALKDAAESTLERISIQIETYDENHPISNAVTSISGLIKDTYKTYEATKDELEVPTVEDEEQPPTDHIFFYRSRTKPENTTLEHEVHILVTEDGDMLHNCSCKAFKYGKVCWAVKDAKESLSSAYR